MENGYGVSDRVSEMKECVPGPGAEGTSYIGKRNNAPRSMHAKRIRSCHSMNTRAYMQNNGFPMLVVTSEQSNDDQLLSTA
jgi:hypothetical protein